MHKPPFQIFPWQRPFLPDLKRFIQKYCANSLGTVTLVVPHKRAWRYLVRLYKEEKDFGLLPKVLTLEEMVAMWSAPAFHAPLRKASMPDCVALLYDCVQQVAREDQTLASAFADMDMRKFLPWGIRLANLLDEMLHHALDIRDLPYTDAEVEKRAAAILGALKRISKLYFAALQRNKLITSGQQYLLARQQVQNIPPLLSPREDRPVFIAGFALLDGAEEILLRQLWQAGAIICLHTDPAIVHNKTSSHWACQIHQEWRERWKASAELAVTDEIEHTPKTQFHFFAGYDYHSQLYALCKDLESETDLSTCAIVLSDNALLMPLLHRLPDKDVNISMGYPLSRTPVARFLQMLFQVQKRRLQDGRYYWRDLIYVLRHPFLGTLHVTDASGKQIFLREALWLLEKALVNVERFCNPEQLAEKIVEETKSCKPLLQEVLRLIFKELPLLQTMHGLADFLEKICQCLVRSGGDIWQRFPLDAEAMSRITEIFIPTLRENLLAEQTLSFSVLQSFFENMLELDRIPFEADPLTGLQVLGMLETRLLHFEHLFILDATEDQLPGHTAQDPLFPDALRLTLGLPDRRLKQFATAYNLYRLCAGAKDVHFYWQDSINRSELFESKKSRSRFIEQIIWKEEQRRGKILISGQPPLAVADCKIKPLPVEDKSLLCDSACQARLNELLSGHAISATMLEHYLQCPLRFALQHLLCINSPQIFYEEDQPALVAGNCIHAVLQKLYAPFRDKTVHKGDISSQMLQQCLDEVLQSEVARHISADSYFMLQTTAPIYLNNFLNNQPEIEIVDIEKELTGSLPTPIGTISLYGKIDRLDRRADGLHILDYKTGSTDSKKTSSLWTNKDLFTAIEELLTSPEQVDDFTKLEELFTELRTKLKSIQLPYYIVLAGCKYNEPIANACLVALKKDGKEENLFQDFSTEQVQVALHYCELTLKLVVTHLAKTQEFRADPIDPKKCADCQYANFCST